MNDPILYEWPNGMRSIAGGTRNEIKLSRPWQKEIEVNPETCPFCTGKGHVLEDIGGGEWRLLQNRFTPYPFHQMIIPRSCFPAQKVRILGGQDMCLNAFFYIQKAIRERGLGKLFMTIHIGELAGQNVPHLHYHIVRYMLADQSESSVPQKMRRIFREKPELVIFEDDVLSAGVGGVRSGQCFILKKSRGLESDKYALAFFVYRVISLYNKKFKSTQGLSPDFSLALQFLDGEFQYGIYTPVLNHWGGTEQMALYESGCSTTLPWPHELTVKHLKS